MAGYNCNVALTRSRVEMVEIEIKNILLLQNKIGDSNFLGAL